MQFMSTIYGHHRFRGDPVYTQNLQIHVYCKRHLNAVYVDIKYAFHSRI